MRRLYSLLPVLIACFLLLQSATACVMPLCPNTAQQAANHEEQSGAHCHAHEADTGSVAQEGSACDDCSVCHLASTWFLSSEEDKSAMRIGVDVFVPQELTLPLSHTARPPLPPPRKHT